jgi:hypothetical protein
MLSCDIRIAVCALVGGWFAAAPVALAADTAVDMTEESIAAAPYSIPLQGPAWTRSRPRSPTVTRKRALSAEDLLGG